MILGMVYILRALRTSYRSTTSRFLVQAREFRLQIANDTVPPFSAHNPSQTSSQMSVQLHSAPIAFICTEIWLEGIRRNHSVGL